MSQPYFVTPAFFNKIDKELGRLDARLEKIFVLARGDMTPITADVDLTLAPGSSWWNNLDGLGEQVGWEVGMAIGYTPRRITTALEVTTGQVRVSVVFNRE